MDKLETFLESVGDEKDEVHYFKGNVRDEEWAYAVRCAGRGDQPRPDAFHVDPGWVSMSAGGRQSVVPVEGAGTDGDKLKWMGSLLDWQKIREDEIPEGGISQFWIRDYWDGGTPITQRYAMGVEDDKEIVRRPFLWGDLGWMVNRDVNRQYLAGMHIMRELGVPANPRNGVHDLVETPFLNLGFLQLLWLQSQVAYACLQTQFAKKYELMEERAAEFARRRCDWIEAVYGIKFEPMYPHPNHPSKGPGHEANAIGHCLIPLWFYDQDFEMPVMGVDEDDRLYDTGDVTCVGDEWRKQYADVTGGRQVAGVHWQEDSIGIVDAIEPYGVDVMKQWLRLGDVDAGRYAFRGVTGVVREI